MCVCLTLTPIITIIIFLQYARCTDILIIWGGGGITRCCAQFLALSGTILVMFSRRSFAVVAVDSDSYSSSTTASQYYSSSEPFRGIGVRGATHSKNTSYVCMYIYGCMYDVISGNNFCSSSRVLMVRT